MKIWIMLFLALALLFADEEANTEHLFELEAPSNWRPETIPFPLSFAPEIDYQGFEELRFAPGMFDPQAKDYFSYIFFFWLENKTKIDSAEISETLLKYYQGLCKVVAEKRELQIDMEKITVEVQETTPADNIQSHTYFATVNWYDAFVTGKELTLYMEIEFFPATDKNSVLFALVSPLHPSTENAQPLWEQMRQIRTTFKVK